MGLIVKAFPDFAIEALMSKEQDNYRRKHGGRYLRQRKQFCEWRFEDGTAKLRGCYCHHNIKALPTFAHARSAAPALHLSDLFNMRRDLRTRFVIFLDVRQIINGPPYILNNFVFGITPYFERFRYYEFIMSCCYELLWVVILSCYCELLLRIVNTNCYYELLMWIVMLSCYRELLW